MSKTPKLHQRVREDYMSRLSQLYWLLNEKTMPTEGQIRHYYTSLSITPEIKKIRREHSAMIRKKEKDNAKTKGLFQR